MGQPRLGWPNPSGSGSGWPGPGCPRFSPSVASSLPTPGLAPPWLFPRLCPSFREASSTCAPAVPPEKRELGQGGTAYGTFSGAQTSLSFALFCYQEILVLYLGSSGFAFIFTLLIPLNFSLDLCPFPSLCHTVVRSQLGTWHVKSKCWPSCVSCLTCLSPVKEFWEVPASHGEIQLCFFCLSPLKAFGIQNLL